MVLYSHVGIVHFFQDMSSDTSQCKEFFTLHTFAYIFHHSAHAPLCESQHGNKITHTVVFYRIKPVYTLYGKIAMGWPAQGIRTSSRYANR